MKKFTVSKLMVSACFIFSSSLFAAEEKKTEEPAQPIKPYLAEVCIVSDEKLSEMGEPFVFVYQNQEIKLCCEKCKPDFDKNPAAFLKKLDEKQVKPE